MKDCEIFNCPSGVFFKKPTRPPSFIDITFRVFYDGNLFVLENGVWKKLYLSNPEEFSKFLNETKQKEIEEDNELKRNQEKTKVFEETYRMALTKKKNTPRKSKAEKGKELEKPKKERKRKAEKIEDDLLQLKNVYKKLKNVNPINTEPAL